jgi:hypothetical protein
MRHVGVGRVAALTRHVDDIALIRSLYTTTSHEPAVYLIQTGRMITGSDVRLRG